MAMSLLTGVYNGKYLHLNLKERLVVLVRSHPFFLYCKYIFRKKKEIPFNFQSSTFNCWLITIMSARESLFNMQYNILKHIKDSKDAKVLMFDTDAYKKLSDQSFEMHYYSIIMKFYKGNLYFEYKNQLNQLNQLLKTQFPRNNLKYFFLRASLFNDALFQINAYLCYKTYLKLIKPKCIIVESDRDNLISPLVLAAKEHGIKTISLMHGNVGHFFGYVPILADHLYVWGKYQKELLIKHGADKDKIEIVGALHFSNKLHKNKIEILNKINIDNNDKILMLGTSNYQPIELRIKLIEIYFHALKRLSKYGWKGIVKLHPRDSFELYRNYKDKNIKFIKNELTLNELFSVSDYCCFASSALAFEAYSRKKNIIVINVSDFLYNGEIKNLVEYGGAIMVKNDEELFESLSNNSFKRFYNYNKNIIYSIGSEATINAIHKTNRLLI